MREKERFIARFLGGIGNNGKPRESLCEVKIVHIENTNSTLSYYRYIGKLSFASLLGADWFKGIVNLDDDKTYPYDMDDLYQGGQESLPIRIYYFSIENPNDKFIANLEFNSMRTKMLNMRMEMLHYRELLASAQKKLHDIDFEDRWNKQESEKAEHYKEVRSKLLYSDRIGFGVP
jgi:hypothetical protein